ncbi:MAG: hypothetical protein PsegKO_25390 [Pseudohongiellaceae bacterium]
MLARYLTYTVEDTDVVNAPQDLQTKEDPMLDSETFDNLVNDIGAENVERIIGMYIEETERQLEELYIFLEQGVLEKASKVAHRTASSTLSFGLNRLGNRLREIEKAGKQDEGFDSGEAAELKSLFDASKSALMRACQPSQQD